MDKSKVHFTYKSPEDAPGFLLYKVYTYWHREIRRSLRPLGLTHAQFVFLANAHWMEQRSDELTQSDIARRTEMDVMMTSNVLRKLEKKGLLNRTPHSRDTRAKVISLTPRGREVLAQAVKVVEDFDHRFFAQLKAPEAFKKELMRLMR